MEIKVSGRLAIFKMISLQKTRITTIASEASHVYFLSRENSNICSFFKHCVDLFQSHLKSLE